MVSSVWWNAYCIIKVLNSYTRKTSFICIPPKTFGLTIFHLNWKAVFQYLVILQSKISPFNSAVISPWPHVWFLDKVFHVKLQYFSILPLYLSCCNQITWTFWQQCPIGRFQTLLRESVKFLNFEKFLWSCDSPWK